MRTLSILATAAILPIQAASASDRWEEALGLLALEEDELGFQPRGYWSRYPLPTERDVPYVLPAFNDLLAEPARIHDYGNTLGHATQRWLVDEAEDHGLARLLYHLGVDRLVSGFRAYWSHCAYCESTADADAPLVAALEKLSAQAEPEDWQELDHATQQALGNLLLDLAVAHEWVERSFRNVDPAVRMAVATVGNLESTQLDGQVYYPAFDDLMQTWDVHSFLTGAQLTTNAVDRAGQALLAIPEPDRRWGGADLSWETALGPVAVTRSCSGEAPTGDHLLKVDLSGCAQHWVDGAHGHPQQPVSVLLDLGGDDRYEHSELRHTNAGEDGERQPAFGAGTGGVGVLWDGGGDDTYAIDERGQGYGQAGVGVLFDLSGDDTYTAHHQAQGAAWFGIGMLADRAGVDAYQSITSSQGSGNAFGAGVLIDGEGDDTYDLEPWAGAAGLAGDYHSGAHILGNNGQGSGFGRRGDLTDGHSWAGGLGFLADLDGNDRYTAGNWAQGVGYWYGTGILYDEQGDDEYSSVYFSSASGAHFAIGAMLDYGGNDRYRMWGRNTEDVAFSGGAGLSFGWDYVASLLLNVGGDDEYSAEVLSIGCANIRSVSIFADIGGDDTYHFPQAGCGLGDTDQRDNYADPHLYYIYSNNVGIFVDLGGRDTYLDRAEDAPERPSDVWRNGSRWMAVREADVRTQLRVYGVGLDRKRGTFWGYSPAP